MFLEFYLFYVFFWERVIGWVRAGGGGVQKMSSPLRWGIKYFPTLFGGVKFYGSILKYPPPPTTTPPPPVHILYDRSLIAKSY